MAKRQMTVLIIASLITISSIVVWQVTGGDFYTKYEVVEQVAATTDPDDPLAATGFYEEENRMETVTRSEFRFGLLPTPSGLLDKHIVSVTSVNGPVWVLTLGLLWWGRRRKVKPR